jgi:hypothetical protein
MVRADSELRQSQTSARTTNRMRIAFVLHGLITAIPYSHVSIPRPTLPLVTVLGKILTNRDWFDFAILSGTLYF